MAEKKKLFRKKNKAEKKNGKFSPPSHTKGYYRFSKDFPSVTDSEGYRDNETFRHSPDKKKSLNRKYAVTWVCVFLISFIATFTAFSVSRLPVSTSSEQQSDASEIKKEITGIKAVCLTGDVLSAENPEGLINELKSYGINTVIIDFKDAAGYFYFKPSIAVSNEAAFKASENAGSIVRKLKNADITVYARVACFADDIYARTNRDKAAYVMTTPESGSNEQVREIWYSDSSDSHAWLNPFSAEVQYYVRTIITDIAALSVDGILFDYAVLPLGYEAENVRFTDSHLYENTPVGQMCEFIKTLNTSYLLCDTGIITDSNTMLECLAENTIPEEAYTLCDFIIPEARLSLIPDNTVIGNKEYIIPANSPSEFIGHYTDSILKLLSTAEDTDMPDVIPLLDASETSSIQIDAIASANGNNYILYNSENIYSQNNF